MYLAPAGAADPIEGANPRVGDERVGATTSKSERCQECHGADGNNENGQFPKLAGQQRTYIAKQLRDFQTGLRRHPIMTAMADGLSEAQRFDIAAYFASREQIRTRSPADPQVARELFERGDAERGIAPCASCHGRDGRGQNAETLVAPRVAGQHYFYLRAQLMDWRSGERRNSPGDVMNRTAERLDDGEISALADYLSGL